MTLFTEFIDKITLEDVKDFCVEKVEEGLRVEYKKDFSPGDKGNRTLAKEISSFANTQGGLILIGVEAKDGIPLLPLAGVSFKEGLHERITSVCLKQINPPVFPQIRICQFEDSSKCIILLRVEESDETPYTVDNGRKIYVRINRQSEPIEAKFEDIEWLINRRKKTVDQRERLIKRAHDRFYNQSIIKQFKSFRTFSIIPLFPSKPLCSIDELGSKIESARTPIMGGLHDFPLNYPSASSHSESLIYTWQQDEQNNPYLYHTEINQYGLVYFAESMWEEKSEENKDKLDIFSILSQLLIATTFVGKLYKVLGFWGLLELKYSLSGIQNKELIISKQGYFPLHHNSSKLDVDIEIIRKISVSDLIERRDEVILDIYKESLWSCGAQEIALNSATLKNHLEREKAEVKL